MQAMSLYSMYVHCLQATSLKVQNMSLCEHFFAGYEPICNVLYEPDPDPHQSEKSDPDPN